MRSISRKLCVRLFTLCKILNLVAPRTEVSVKCLVRYKRIWSITECRKQRPNRCIIGDSILPQTGTKLTKKRGSKFGALLWRHLTP